MKKVIIVGATSGIGRELAKLYAADGCEVGIAGRRTELLASLASELPTKSYQLALDIAEPEKAMNSLSQLIEEMQDVDLIIISSGTGFINGSLDWAPEKETIATNVMGFAAVANVAMNYFLKRKKGHLAGISSIAAIRGGHEGPAYNASKAFVSNYLEGLRVKAAKMKVPVTVTDIQPGLVDTAMAKGEGLFWVAPVPKAAKQIYQAIAKRKAKAYVTRRWALIALLLKLLPDWLYQKI